MANYNMEPWLELNNKVVLVTGASSGLGREFCLDLAKAGCKIVAAARRTDRLQSLCEEINNNSTSGQNDGQPWAVPVSLDVMASGPTIEASVKESWDAFGRIDVLINNAGIRGPVRAPLDVPEDEWDEINKTNLTGTWLVTKYVCKLMRDAQCGGSVINISTAGGLNRVVMQGNLSYSVSKAGVDTFTRGMAMELGAHNIRVNSIAPGVFKSEITQGLLEKKWIKNVVRKTVPLRSSGETDPALTSLVRYLIHDSSKYVTGNIFIVDSGSTLPGVPLYSSL